MKNMVLVLGVSSDATGARALLAHSDSAAEEPIDWCHIPRRPGSSLAEPVLTAIRHVRRAATGRGELITRTAVSCENAQHARAVRAALGRLGPMVVAEPVAQLRYLRFISALPEDGSVLLYDLGNFRLSLTHIDCRTDTVVAHQNCDLVSCLDITGNAAATDPMSPVAPMNGSKHTATADPDVRPLYAARLHRSVVEVHKLLAAAPETPQTVFLLGSALRSPSTRQQIIAQLPVPVQCPRAPEFVAARGAVLFAADRHGERSWSARLPAPSPPAPAPAPAPQSVSKGKLLAAAAVTGGLALTVLGLLAHGAPTPTLTDRQIPAPPTVLGIPPTVR